MTRYPLAIEPGDEQTAFGAAIPDIGAVSAGDTREEARRNVAEAARIVLEERQAPNKKPRHMARAFS